MSILMFYGKGNLHNCAVIKLCITNSVSVTSNISIESSCADEDFSG